MPLSGSQQVLKQLNQALFVLGIIPSRTSLSIYDLIACRAVIRQAEASKAGPLQPGRHPLEDLFNGLLIFVGWVMSPLLSSAQFICVAKV